MAADQLHTLPGPALLLAGPGTGKTYQLALRINYLVKERGVPPEEITVISFTRPAAANMRERISDKRKKEVYLARKAQPKLICTMHHLGYLIVRAHPEAAGYAEAPSHVVEKDLRPALLGDAAQLLGLPRDEGGEAAHCREAGDCRHEEGSARCRVCERYRAILRSCGAIDHDDQILLACRLLRDVPEAREQWKRAARHLLVDEYQDINAAQYELIRLLSDGQREGLFAVGDDDQSIYSFRGGSPRFIRSFKEDFGEGATVEALSVSYRCHPHVLEGAMHLVERCDLARLPKAPFEFKNPEGAKIKLHSAPSDAKEAAQVLRIIQAALPDQGVLVLLPTRKFLPLIAAELQAARIPFVGPVASPGEGLPLLARLARWLGNPKDSLAMRACLEAFLESPSSGVPSRFVRKPEKKEARERAYMEIASLWAAVVDGGAPGLWAALSEKGEGDGTAAKACEVFSRIQELYQAGQKPELFLEAFAASLSPWRDVKAMLREAAAWKDLAGQAPETEGETKVRIMTLEGAKGLEADVVCVVGLEKGVIPRAGEDEAEQARKVFVSMTRATRELHLFHARKRSGAVVLRGQFKEGRPDTARSPFLDLIPGEHVEKVYHDA